VRDKRSPTPRSESVSRSMSGNRRRDTKPELLLRKALWQEKIRGYRLQARGIPGRPDIYFPKSRVAVFVHGCFWHRCPSCNLGLPRHNMNFWKEKFDRNVARDQKKQALLETEGWQVVTCWECELKRDVSDCVNKIRRSLSASARHKD
jgi:DNA mismatch endonuclease, patch repair protein